MSDSESSTALQHIQINARGGRSNEKNPLPPFLFTFKKTVIAVLRNKTAWRAVLGDDEVKRFMEPFMKAGLQVSVENHHVLPSGLLATILKFVLSGKARAPVVQNLNTMVIHELGTYNGSVCYSFVITVTCMLLIIAMALLP